MNLESTVVLPGRGMGGLVFGMSTSQVVAFLGQPDEEENDQENALLLWHYDDAELSLSFDSALDNKLAMIASSEPSAALSGFTLLGKSRTELIGELKEAGINDLYYEEEEGQEATLSSEAMSLCIWFEDGVSSELQFWPLLDEEGELSWPN